MPEYLHSVIVQEASLAASTVTDLIDLPVNPVSHLVLNLEALNDTATFSDFRMRRPFDAFISKVEILFKGQNIIEGNLDDLSVLWQAITRRTQGQSNMARDDNARRGISYVIPFGRKLFDMMECFPATSRGEFQIRLTSTTAQTGLDAVTFNLEAVELLNATPTHFMKQSTFTGTQAQTGEADLDLPRGNPIGGILLFGTTIGQADEQSNTIRTLRLLVDNQERFYSKTNWNALRGLLDQRVASESTAQAHTHAVDVADASGTVRDTTQQEGISASLMRYAYLDFDPMDNGQYWLETAGRGRVHMRVDFGATDAMRYVVFEQIAVS